MIMNIEQAMNDLVNRSDFRRDAAKIGALRTFRRRYTRGEMKNGAAIDMLIRYGYRIDVKKPKHVHKSRIA